MKATIERKIMVAMAPVGYGLAFTHAEIAVEMVVRTQRDTTIKAPMAIIRRISLTSRDISDTIL